MPMMTRIPADLARFGLKVETVPGWENRGSASFAPAGVVCHWTAGPARSTTRPILNLVINGRADLPGPLCNVYLARDGACVVVAAGRANHAGAGSWKGLVGNSAVYGIEAEAAGPNDWTAAQREAYPRLVAALLWGLTRSSTYACGHSEWAGPRKTDINGYTMDDMRAQVARLLIAGPDADVPTSPTLPEPLQEADMRLIQSPGRGIALVGAGYFSQLSEEAVPIHVAAYGKPVDGNDRQFDLLRAAHLGGVGIGSTAADLNAAVAKLADVDGADVDEDALAAALAPRLAGVTVEQLRDAIRGLLNSVTT